MSLPNSAWEEVEPCVYQRREYTPKQVALLDRRPTEMIAAALASSSLTSKLRGGE